MNKYLLSAVLLLSSFYQSANAQIKNCWFPKYNLSALDAYYEDVQNTRCKEIHQFMRSFYLEEFKRELKESPLSFEGKVEMFQKNEEFISTYTKYLSIYLSFAMESAEFDTAIIEYLSKIDHHELQKYFDEFIEEYFKGMTKLEVIQLVQRSVTGELFSVWMFFLSDKHFQQEVERYADKILVKDYSINKA